MLCTVPVLDLEQYARDQDNRMEFASALGRGLVEVGFVRLRGHGVPANLLSLAYDLATDFFESPLPEKMLVHAPASHGQRGYTPFGTEHAKDSNCPDLKEFLMIGPEEQEANLWPLHPPGFPRVFLSILTSLERVAVQVLRALADHFGLETDFFASMVVNGNSALRVIHYPPINDDLDRSMPGSVRSAQHEDINMVTVMPASTYAGLQIMDRSGIWMDVLCVPGELIVNTGDMLARVTNGAVPSTTHRVINPASAVGRGRSRFALPGFIHPRKDVRLEVPPCFRGAGFPEPPPTVTAIEALNERLAEIGLR
jgi:isopenicillin N synthase-like dioxygenase